MTLRGKLEGEAEIKASTADVLYDIVKNKPHHISDFASHFVQGVDLVEGEHGKLGSIAIWKYTLEGKPMVAKKTLEEIDEEKKFVKYRAIEGDVMKEYKSITGSCEVIPKDSKTCIAKFIFEYEKMNVSVPKPSALVDAWIDATKHIDDHHQFTMA
ncbi:MLP-like protein 43 [Bienertia sinuspersici]